MQDPSGKFVLEKKKPGPMMGGQLMLSGAPSASDTFIDVSLCCAVMSTAVLCWLLGAQYNGVIDSIPILEHTRLALMAPKEAHVGFCCCHIVLHFTQ